MITCSLTGHVTNPTALINYPSKTISIETHTPTHVPLKAIPVSDLTVVSLHAKRYVEPTPYTKLHLLLCHPFTHLVNLSFIFSASVTAIHFFLSQDQLPLVQLLQEKINKHSYSHSHYYKLTKCYIHL